MLRAEVIHLSFRHVAALRGASIEVEAGRVVGIVGPNGAGKSTLLKVIAGLHRPDSGHVSYAGQPLSAGPVSAVRAGVVLAPQGRRLFNSMTVRENLVCGGYARPDRSAIDEDIEKWTEQFPEVRELFGRRAGTLSGGQQQVVALVRALVANPKVLLLDEPSMGVAPRIVARMGEEIVRLAHEHGLGILLVEQNVSLALKVSDTIVVMSRGRHTYCGPPSGVSDPDTLTQYFFETEPTTPTR